MLTVNQVLLLQVIADTPSQRIEGATRFQKLVFMSQWKFRNKERMNDNMLAGFNYLFKRWNYGPYSPQLQNDLDSLCLMGLIKRDFTVPYYFSLTEEGDKHLQENSSTIHEEVQETIQDVVNEYGELKLADLLHKVYQDVDLINKYRMGETILAPVQSEKLNLSFPFN